MPGRVVAVHRRRTPAMNTCVPVEEVVQDVNRFLRGWAGYFRYGNSADSFDKLAFHALVRGGLHRKAPQAHRSLRLVDGHSPVSGPAGADQP